MGTSGAASLAHWKFVQNDDWNPEHDVWSLEHDVGGLYMMIWRPEHDDSES